MVPSPRSLFRRTTALLLSLPTRRWPRAVFPHSLNHDSGQVHRPNPTLCTQTDSQSRSVGHGVSAVAERS